MSPKHSGQGWITKKGWVLYELERGQTRDQIFNTVQLIKDPTHVAYGINWNYICQIDRKRKVQDANHKES